MGQLWLKIKVGCKIAIFAILSLAVLVFLIQNVNKPVKLWLWNDIDTTLLKALFVTALLSVVFTILLGTTFRTIRQIREIRTRSRAEKLEQDIRDMKSKAAMLQTKPVGGGTTPASTIDVAPPVSDLPPTPPEP
jgi:hypothetical protein